MSIANELVLAQEMMFSNGGKSLLAMRSLKPNLSFLSPGIIDVTHAIDIPDKEWFGPLLQVIRVKNFSEAMNVANRTAYGLSAGLLSDDETLWKQYFAVARAGIVNWNRPTTGASSRAPFGGIGHSGNHRPSAYYAADYCAYPVASTEAATVTMPLQRAPGIIF
jgi:succinylglutamic semialdehyde dehydrogenase